MKKIDIGIIDVDHYYEVEIDILERGNSTNTFSVVETVVLDHDATLIADTDEATSNWWSLHLSWNRDRRSLMNKRYFKFMIAVYENTEEEPYPARGKCVMRVPLIDKIFSRPKDYELRGKGSVVRLYTRTIDNMSWKV